MDPRKRGGGGKRDTQEKQGWEQGVEGFGIRDTWGWGTARDFRETLRNRERRKLGYPGVGEVDGSGRKLWVKGRVGKDGNDAVTMEHPFNVLTHQLTNILIH